MNYTLSKSITFSSLMTIANKSVQNVVHLHACTLSVAISQLADGRVNNVLLQTVPDISEALLQQ